MNCFKSLHSAAAAASDRQSAAASNVDIETPDMEPSSKVGHGRDHRRRGLRRAELRHAR
jgi:hypothetical protein